jgi:chemotaxis protein MotB
MRKREESKEQNTAQWITTYTDLMTLLLTFFVLLLSMSQREEIRTRKALNSLVGAFGLLPGGRSPLGKPKGMDIRDPSPPVVPSKPVNFEVLKEITITSNLHPDIQILKQKEKLIIRINQKVLFMPGSTELTPNAQQYLAILAEHLEHDQGDIEIRGHTDRFEQLNNENWTHQSWMISARRAQAVHHFLMKQGIDFDRLSAHGFSHQQTLVDGLDFPDLRYKNQRVELVLGPDSKIPQRVLRQEPTPRSFLNYKDFLFRILPEEGK